MDFNAPLTDPKPVSEPSGERPCPRCGAANAHDASTCAACHRFLPGNVAALTHGGRRSLDRPEALAAIAGKREELIQHLGGDPSMIQADLITDYARVDVLIESVAANIEVGGIFTPKGHARAAVSLLLSLLDRRLRLATTLGILRKAKPVASLVEVMSGK
jgi:hypothetical protein